MALICFLFFVFGIATGWSTASQDPFLDFISKFGNFLAAISALLAVTLTIAHKEYLRFRKTKGLQNVCQLELEGYSDQLQEFFLFFLYDDGVFINSPGEWISLKPKFPDAPNIFQNHDSLLDLEIDFVTNIAALIRNRNNILKLIRKVDDLLSSRGGLFDHERKEILLKAKFLYEQFCASYNEVSRSSKFLLPENSIFHVLKRHS